MSATAASERIWFLDNLARVHLDGARTGGAYSLVEMHGPPGDTPPLHVHRREDEAFHVLEGRLRLFVGDDVIDVGPGESAIAPAGVPHVYRVESQEPARWLVVCSPAGFEDFVREVGEAAEDDALPPRGRPFDAATLTESAGRHGIEILGPPGALPDGA